VGPAKLQVIGEVVRFSSRVLLGVSKLTSSSAGYLAGTSCGLRSSEQCCDQARTVYPCHRDQLTAIAELLWAQHQDPGSAQWSGG